MPGWCIEKYPAAVRTEHQTEAALGTAQQTSALCVPQARQAIQRRRKQHRAVAIEAKIAH